MHNKAMGWSRSCTELFRMHGTGLFTWVAFASELRAWQRNRRLGMVPSDDTETLMHSSDSAKIRPRMVAAMRGNISTTKKTARHRVSSLKPRAFSFPTWKRSFRSFWNVSSLYVWAHLWKLQCPFCWEHIGHDKKQFSSVFFSKTFDLNEKESPKFSQSG